MVRKALWMAMSTVLVLALLAVLMPTDRPVVPSEIEVLIQPYADQIGPPTAVTFSGAEVYVWWGDDALVLRRQGRWYIAGFTARGESKVPPLYVALMVQSAREKQRQGTWQARPIAPWSETVVMPDEALHPEVR